MAGQGATGGEDSANTPVNREKANTMCTPAPSPPALAGSTLAYTVGAPQRSPPQLAGSKEDDQKQSKDDMESGSDQDDILEVFEMFLSQDNPAQRTPKERTSIQPPGGQEKKTVVKVPEQGIPPVTSLLEVDVAANIGSPPTSMQSGLTQYNVSGSEISFVWNRARGETVVQVSDTSSDDGGDNEEGLSPLRAMVVGDKGEEDEIIPATPEPSVGEFRNYRASRPEQTGKHSRVLKGAIHVTVNLFRI